MRNLNKNTLRDLGIVAALALVGIATLLGLFWFTLTMETICRNDVLSSTEIAETDLKVVKFQRDCGATTGFSTQASVIPTRDDLTNERGNIFAADTNHGSAPSGPGGGPEITVRVINPKEIQLSYHPNARVFRAETNYKQVKIIYSMSLGR